MIFWKTDKSLLIKAGGTGWERVGASLKFNNQEDVHLALERTGSG